MTSVGTPTRQPTVGRNPTVIAPGTLRRPGPVRGRAGGGRVPVWPSRPDARSGRRLLGTGAAARGPTLAEDVERVLFRTPSCRPVSGCWPRRRGAGRLTPYPTGSTPAAPATLVTSGVRFAGRPTTGSELQRPHRSAGRLDRCWPAVSHGPALARPLGWLPSDGACSSARPPRCGLDLAPVRADPPPVSATRLPARGNCRPPRGIALSTASRPRAVATDRLHASRCCDRRAARPRRRVVGATTAAGDLRHPRAGRATPFFPCVRTASSRAGVDFAALLPAGRRLRPGDDVDGLGRSWAGLRRGLRWWTR